jgi:phosphocarrier protein FPr/phosphocarrier protein
VEVTAGGFLGGREALKISALTERFVSDLWVNFGGMEVNARSVAAIMVLGVIPGDRVGVTGAGPDAVEAARAMARLIASGPSAARGKPQLRAAGSAVGRSFSAY